MQGQIPAGPLPRREFFPFPSGDREALSGALEKVLSDDALRNALCQRSRRAQEQYFSWNAIAARYADTLGGPGTASTGWCGRGGCASPENKLAV